jgi:rhamnogalacturonyl hydrolase YesR
MATQKNRLDMLRRAAERTAVYPYRVWGFGEGHALLGLLAAAELLDRSDLADSVRGRVAPSLTAPPNPEDHLIAVDVLLRLRQVNPVLDTQPSAQRFVSSVEGAARPVAGEPAVHRPDLAGLGRLIWVDCMHTDGPGLAALGRPAGELLEESAAVLQDDSGLFHHGYDVYARRPNGVRWGRGQGWALWGLIATLVHEDDARLRQRLDALVDALEEHEIEGRWMTIVDDPEAPLEASVSALVAAALLGGLQAGVVRPEAAGLADRALAAACADAEDGALTVSEATPVGTAVTYLSRRTGVFPWGQGPLLVALAVAAGWAPFAPTDVSVEGDGS